MEEYQPHLLKEYLRHQFFYYQFASIQTEFGYCSFCFRIVVFQCVQINYYLIYPPRCDQHTIDQNSIRVQIEFRLLKRHLGVDDCYDDMIAQLLHYPNLFECFHLKIRTTAKCFHEFFDDFTSFKFSLFQAKLKKLLLLLCKFKEGLLRQPRKTQCLPHHLLDILQFLKNFGTAGNYYNGVISLLELKFSYLEVRKLVNMPKQKVKRLS